MAPNVLNSAVFSYNRNNGTRASGAPFGLRSIGVDIAESKPEPEVRFEIPGFFSVNTGTPGQFSRQNFHFADSMHWIHGTHEIAFGGDFLRMKVDLINTFRQSGRFRFRGSNYTGNALADFMVGRVERFQQGGGEFAARRGNLGSLFVQDNLRVSRRLVLNAGLRWDPFVPYGDERGMTECFIAGRQSQRYPKAPTGYLFAGDSGCPAGGSQSNWLQFSPRIGLAYSAGGRGNTTIRSGFGVFYQPPFVEAFNNMVDSAPFSPQILIFGVPFDNPYVNTRNPFPAEFGPKVPGPDAEFQKPILGVSYATDWKPARIMSWNLTVEHQLVRDVLVRAAYVGAKGTHLGFNTDLDAAPFRPGATDSNTQARRPYQDFTQITQNVPGGNSIYNSLQLSVDKRFSRGITLGANYTFARSIDYVSYLTDLDGINVINPFNARAYRGPSDYNVPHRFVLNYVWHLPSPASGALRHVLGGWESSGLWNWQSGFPLTITSNEDRALSGVGNDTADVIGKPSLTSGSKADRILKWFTKEAFLPAATGTFGNSGRNILPGPNTFNIDLSAIKNFRFTERWRLQYRAEFFNAFNHTQLNNPGTGLGSATLGRITSARDPRIVQMALKLFF
jgi:hypothetical protein